MDDYDDFELGVEIGIARDAAEADSDDPIARLPRLIRYGLNAIGHKKSIRERIGGEIWEIAPELAPKVTAWLAGYRDAPMKALVKRLDSLSVQSDRPVLRSLANAVLLVSLSPFLRDRQAQSRIALALKVAFDEIAFDIPLETRVQAARLLVGWTSLTRSTGWLAQRMPATSYPTCASPTVQPATRPLRPPMIRITALSVTSISPTPPRSRGSVPCVFGLNRTG